MKPTDKHIDLLKELINIGVGRGASVLNTMLSSHINLQVPYLKIVYSLLELKEEISRLGNIKRLSTINMKFKGNFSGVAQLVFATESASKLVTALVGEEQTIFDLDSIQAGTLCEVGNIVLNGIMGSIANVLKINFSYSVPNYMEESVDSLFPYEKDKDDLSILLARTKFKVEKLDIDGSIVLFLEVSSLEELLLAIDSYSVNLGMDIGINNG